MTKSLRKNFFGQNLDFCGSYFLWHLWNWSFGTNMESNAAVTLHFEDLAVNNYLFWIYLCIHFWQAHQSTSRTPPTHDVWTIHVCNLEQLLDLKALRSTVRLRFRKSISWHHSQTIGKLASNDFNYHTEDVNSIYWYNLTKNLLFPHVRNFAFVVVLCGK